MSRGFSSDMYTPLSCRHLIRHDPKSRIPYAHDAELIPYTRFIRRSRIDLRSLACKTYQRSSSTYHKNEVLFPIVRLK